MRRALEGQEIAVEFGDRRLTVMKLTLRGLRVSCGEALGIQIRIHLSDRRLILVHLMMWSSWRICRNRAAQDKPAEKARLILRTAKNETVAFSAPVIQVLTTEELHGDSPWSRLSPAE